MALDLRLGVDLTKGTVAVGSGLNDASRAIRCIVCVIELSLCEHNE